MKSIKIILGGIGLLLFAVCCILLGSAGWNFMVIPAIASMLVGIVMVVRGIFTNGNQ